MDVCDFASPPIIVAAVLSEHHVLKDGPQLRAGHPEQHLHVG